MAFCKQCGSELENGVKFCPKCGAAVESGVATNPTPPIASESRQQPEVKVKSADTGHGLAIGSLVCGIIGIVLWFFGYTCLISVVLGIVGLVLAGNAKKEGNTEGIRTAGFIVSLIALIIGIIITLYLCLVVALVGTAVNGIFSILQLIKSGPDGRLCRILNLIQTVFRYTETCLFKSSGI